MMHMHINKKIQLLPHVINLKNTNVMVLSQVSCSIKKSIYAPIGALPPSMVFCHLYWS